MILIPPGDIEGFPQGRHEKLSCINYDYFPSALFNAISPVQSYQFPTPKTILKLCQVIIYQYLPPVLSHHFCGNCVLPLHKGQFKTLKILPIDLHGVLSPIFCIHFLCCRNLYRLINAEIRINYLFISPLDRQEQEERQTG